MHLLVERLLALDLMTTSLEGDDWCIEVDRALQDAAREIERLTTSLNLSTDQNGATVRNVHKQPERHQ